MKFLKIALILVLLLVVAFLAIGFIKPSVSYQNEVLINAPKDKSWQVMMDPSKLNEWLTGYKRSELISGEAGTVGAVSNIYFDQNGKEIVIKETITVVENDVLGMDFENDFMDMKYDIRIQEIEGKSQLSSRTTAKAKGMVSRSITSLMKGTLVNQEQTNLDKLKRVIEAE